MTKPRNKKSPRQTGPGGGTPSDASRSNLSAPIPMARRSIVGSLLLEEDGAELLEEEEVEIVVITEAPPRWTSKHDANAPTLLPSPPPYPAPYPTPYHPGAGGQVAKLHPVRVALVGPYPRGGGGGPPPQPPPR
jgi:hypothetical protein